MICQQRKYIIPWQTKLFKYWLTFAGLKRAKVNKEITQNLLGLDFKSCHPLSVFNIKKLCC